LFLSPLSLIERVPISVRGLATVQLVLPHLANDEILEFFNELLETGVVRIEARVCTLNWF
jgi:hypothetical protein